MNVGARRRPAILFARGVGCAQELAAKLRIDHIRGVPTLQYSLIATPAMSHMTPPCAPDRRGVVRAGALA